MTLTAEDLYRTLTEEIDRAVRAHNIYAVPAAAEAARMQGGQTHSGLSERWRYEYVDPDGALVRLHCRWYDQSKPFSNAPDMHNMSVELTAADGSAKSHNGSYEE
jgi:hypothetical protein